MDLGAPLIDVDVRIFGDESDDGEVEPVSIIKNGVVTAKNFDRNIISDVK